MTPGTELHIERLKKISGSLLPTLDKSVNYAERLRLWCQVNSVDNQEKATEYLLTINDVLVNLRELTGTLIKELEEKDNDAGN